MFSTENIFMENDFSENIFRWKSFYVEVNGAKKKKKKTRRAPQSTLQTFTYKSFTTSPSCTGASLLHLHAQHAQVEQLVSLSAKLHSSNPMQVLSSLFFFVESYIWSDSNLRISIGNFRLILVSFFVGQLEIMERF
jgi:hypothetical protein